jgi:serine/threonine protein kinase
MTETNKWPWDKPKRDSQLPERARLANVEPRLITYCRELGIAPTVNPGLDPNGPPVTHPGDERYAVGGELGRGGGGVVYLGTDRSLRRSVALKVLSPELVTDPIRVQAFVEEAIITGGLEHPNIVPAYELGVSTTLGIYYTMKRLTGRPLAGVIAALRKGDPATLQAFGMYRLLGCFIELCRAVAYAHSRGVLHCDLKPENVLIGEYGEVVLVDWGLAQMLGQGGKDQARARMHAGTPEYMAPEQITKSGQDLDVRSDIWALGVILYELLTLTVPFQGASAREVLMRVMVEPLEPPAIRAPGRTFPPGVDDIVRRALSKNREFRYASVGDLLADLEAELEGTRERLRRAEQARRSLETVDALLGRLRALESEVDGLLAAHPPREDTGEVRTAFSDEPRLADRRRVLLGGDQEAAEHLFQGIESDHEEPSVSDAAGDLYWRIFLRIYPSHTPTSGQNKDIANDLLNRLSEKAFSAVIRAGRKLTRARDSASRSTVEVKPATVIEDPWLSVVSTLCNDENEELDPTQAPSALRQLIQRITFLQRISLFNAVPAFSLLPIAEACQEYNFGPDQPIFRQGDAGDSICMLLEGHVEVVRDGAVINRLGPGDVCGEVAVLGQAARTAGVIATEPVKTLMLGADRFRRIVRENGDIGLAVIQVLSERLRVATERESALRSLAKTILAKRVDLTLP